MELRSLVFQLRPAELETEGLAAALRKHVELLRRAHRAPDLARRRRRAAAAPGVDEEVFRIAQESLQNALRHAERGTDRRASRGGRRTGCG